MGFAGPKTSTQHVPALSFWLVRGEGSAHSHAQQHSLPHARPLTFEAYRCTKPLCHRKRYCPQTCKHFLVCQHLHYMVGGRWRCSAHHLGPHPGSKLWRETGKKTGFGPCKKTTENMTTTQIFPLNMST